jgi:hypothetical protein
VHYGLEVERWAFWSPESRNPAEWRAHWSRPAAAPVEGKVPDDALPAAHRRRMSPLSRLAVQMALEASAGTQADFLVFASQHGELTRTRELLDDIIAAVELSPTSFSQSVHNTGAGLYTIIAGSHAPATSLAAGPATFAYGWLEAETFLAANPDKRVLLVVYDGVLPPEYASYLQQVQCTYGTALLLKRAANGAAGIALEHARAQGADERLPLAPLFVAWSQTPEPSLAVSLEGQAWVWTRDAR